MKKKNRLLRLSFLIAFLAFFGLGQNAWAQATWYSSGAVSLGAGQEANWQNNPAGGGAPLGVWDDDGIYVVRNTDVLTLATATVGELQINSTGAHTSAGAVVISGDLVIGANCGLGGNQVTVSGSTTVESGNTLTLAALLITGTLEVETTGVLATAGIGLTVNGLSTVTGSITSSGGALSFAATTIAVGGNITTSGGSAAFSGLVTNNATLDLTGATATMGAGLTNTLGTTTVGTSLAVTGNVLVSAGSIATAGNTFSVTGTTTIAGGASIISSGGNKTFGGAVILSANNSTLDLTGTTAAVTTASTTLDGLTAVNTVDLALTGSGAITLPATVAALRSITISGGATVTLSAALARTIGFAGNSVVISNGYLNLNGNNLTLGHADAVIQETGNYGIINNGTAGAYVTTVASSVAQIHASGIGVTGITSAGTPAGLVIRRYPQAVSPIPGFSNSVQRIYELNANSGDAITGATFAYRNSELNDNTVADLETFQSTIIDFSANLVRATTNNNSVSNVITSSGVISGVAGRFYTFGMELISTGVVTASTGDWNNPYVWSPAGVPDADAIIVIPTGVTMTIPAGVAAVAKSITVNGTGSLVMTGAAPSLTLAEGGDLIINSTNPTAFTTSGTTGAVTITIPGNFEINSTGGVNLSSGTTVTLDYVNVDIAGTFTNNGGATITTNGDVTDFGTRLTLSGSTTVNLPTISTIHSLTVNKVGATVYQSSDLTIAGPATLTVTSGTYVVGDNNLVVTGNTTIAAGATLNANYTSASVTRIFTGTVALNGTLNSSGPRHADAATFNNTFTGIVTLQGTGVLNVANSKTQIQAIPVFNSGCIITATGADIRFNGAAALNFTGLTLNTNSNTDLTLNITGFAVTNFPISVTQLKNLTIDGDQNMAFSLTSDLTLAGDLILEDQGAAGTSLAMNGFNLTVNGKFNNKAGATTYNVVNVGTGTLTLNGEITEWGVDQLNLVFNLGSLVIGGAGDIQQFPAATAPYALGNVTMNRAGKELDLSIINAAPTFASLTITSGTVRFDAGIAAVVTGATTIGANGTLVTNGATSVTFNGAVTGTGTIDADHADDYIIVSSGNFTFTGNLITANTTILEFNTTAATVSLPSSVTQLEELRLLGALAHNVTLNNNLTLLDQIAAANFANAAATLFVNGYTLTLTGGIANTGATTLDLTNGSTLSIGAAADLAAMTLVEDETTNLYSVNAITNVPATFTQCNNLTLATAGAFTTSVDFTINGNLTIGSGCTFTVPDNGGAGAHDLTVKGDISNLGTLTINADANAPHTLTVHGSIQGVATAYNINANTNLVIAGSGSQFNMPAGITTLGTLTLNRASGAKLNANLTVGIAATQSLIITSGDLDLNGYTITLAAADATMSETAGNTVINTGASGASNGFIQTFAGVTAAQAIASGIGVSALTLGVDATQVLRYPITIPIIGVGLSTSRVYQILTNNVTVASFIFDNTELNSSASDLKLYTAPSTDFAFAVATDQTALDGANRLVTENSPVSGKGTVAYSSMRVTPVAAGSFFALAAVPGDGGVMRIASAAGNWGSAATWSPAGIPTKVDQVVIGPATVTLNGNGVTYEAKTLHLNHANSTLQPFDNSVNGDVVNLRVMGNITLVDGAEILGVNGQGRINLIIGDGVTTGVGSAITGNADYVATSGIWVNDLTVNTADLTSSANRIRVSGDIALIANSAVSLPSIEFWGGYDANQTISVPSSANLSIATARFDNSANVTTTSDFTLTNHFLVKSGSSFNATGGTAFFTNGVTPGPWNVEDGATLRFNNVEFNHTSNFVPLGTAYIQGNFWQYNTGDFAPTSGRVIFSNTSQKEIVNTSAIGDLKFYELEIAAGAKVVTSNNWQVAKEIDVKQNASLIADNGTIQMIGTAPLYIKNASTQTLEFNNLTVTNTTYTSDSWTIKGDLTTAAALIADNGTITFQNIQAKTITPTVASTFFKMQIADGSKVTTAAPHNFTIANNATNPSGAGIEVVGTGEFYVGAPTAVTTFNAGVGLAAGYPKMITKSEAGTLRFGLLSIAASPNNEVATSSDFEIRGAGPAAFSNLGAGGKFTATGGTITFTGANPEIQSVSPAVTQFYSLKTLAATSLTFPAAAQEIYVAGNITVDGQSSFLLNQADRTDAKINFNGSALQTIGGNSTALIPVSLADVVINKANNSELLLDINTAIGAVAGHELTLTNGILNLGSKRFTNGSNLITRHNGVINGGTGTYVIAANHQSPKLEDVYFTIDGTPTLYNLTVNTPHTTANDLTVNGTLNLSAGALTIAGGVDASNPIELVLNGNLTRTSGTIAGDPITSRLVLNGSGTIANGLSNVYFGGTATTVQLELGRGETLGGNLNIAGTSYLRMNTGINDLNLSTNTLTFTAGSFLTMISGGIKSGTGSTVNLTTAITTIPASMFRNNEVNNLTIGGPISLAGDLKVNGTLNGPHNITTKDNVLTFAQNATIPAYTDAAHVVGNLRRYVTNTATVFSVGDGTALVPVTLQFANAGSVMPVLVKRTYVDPTLNKGGNATNSVNVLWTITPEGTAVNDSIRATFGWPTTLDGGILPTANASFPAKWNGLSWTDYRSRLNNFAVVSPRVLTMNGFAVANPAALAGDWAVFNASANTDAAKDAAISVTNNKIVITSLEPSPVVLNNAFKVTVQLQDQFGQPITATSAYSFTLSKDKGAGTFADFAGVIPAGQSMTTVSGLSVSGTAGGNHQLKVDTTGSSSNWTATVSDLFDVLPVAPGTQASNITFSNVGATSMKISWSTGVDAIVMIKPDTLLTSAEFPVNGTTYYANTIVGAGSNIGGATVVYNGTLSTVNVTGLAPNTTYYVYVFNYTGTDANENYRTTAASGNPKSVATTGSYDDDITYGINNTRTTSKTIGTNTPIKATIRSAGDEDWFNFTVTNVSPNVRAQIYGLPGNYTLEVYDMDGRRIRRSTLGSTSSEAAVINNLPSGTYTVRIFSQDGSFWTRSGEEYTLKVSTFGNEIYAVTP